MTWPLLLGGVQARHVLLETIRHTGFRTTRCAPALLTRGRAAARSFLVVGARFAGITLVLAIAVSFLAASYTSEARAPAADDAVAVVPVEVVARVSPIVVRDHGSTSIYLEMPTTLRLQEPPPPQSPLGGKVTGAGAIEDVNITFYDCAGQGFCARMYNGEYVYEGAAACSWDLPLGTAFSIQGDPTQRIYVCKDRGLLPDTWVDIFWYHPADGYSWQAQVGRYGTIQLVYLP